MIYGIDFPCIGASAPCTIASLCFIAYLFFSSFVSAIRITFPPFKDASSLLSIVRDPSLVPPFGIQPNLNRGNESKGKRKCPPSERSNLVGVGDVVHFCFLVHGYKGLSGDLAYFETMLKHRTCIERQLESQNDDDFVRISNPSDANDGGDAVPLTIQDMVIHNCICNERKTTDGVTNGGDRLIDEIRRVIDSRMKQIYSEANHVDGIESVGNITISIIGNSMGGLYGRYAIAKLIERHCVAIKDKEKEEEIRRQGRQTVPSSWVLDGKYRLRLDTFCTTASPHLGVSRFTWIRIPRIAEMGVATTMGKTGRDLFRLNNLLYLMATDSTFLDPLAAFRKRIAYANCFGTDFPVPVETAAFLSNASTYPHMFLRNFQVEDECNLVIATMETKATGQTGNNIVEPSNELHHMSVSLDSLGWKKVFVDLQEEMFSIELPWPAWAQRNQSSKRLRENYLDERSRLLEGTNLWSLKKNKKVSSKDIINAVVNPNANNALDKRIILRVPTGHNMIAAFSRSRVSTHLNKGGRPMVDSLAKELVGDIFSSSRNKESLD